MFALSKTITLSPSCLVLMKAWEETDDELEIIKPTARDVSLYNYVELSPSLFQTYRELYKIQN